MNKTLPLHKITDEEIKSFCDEDTNDKIKVIWIGHATSLVNMENTIILMDPVFSHRFLFIINQHLETKHHIIKTISFLDVRQVNG